MKKQKRAEKKNERLFALNINICLLILIEAHSWTVPQFKTEDEKTFLFVLLHYRICKMQIMPCRPDTNVATISLIFPIEALA